MKRIAMGLEYNGAGWHGWQSQPDGNTLQDALEYALQQVAGQPVSTLCAGRTDAGVHALHQVVHFDSAAPRPLTAWVRGVNSFLPPSLSVRWAQAVAPEFHARFSARGRRYRYRLLNRAQRPGLEHGKLGWYHAPLDLSLMQAAASQLLGTHDFSAFRAAQCQAKSPVKTLLLARITQSNDVFDFDFAADAFLHHMIRNLVGALVYVGAGKISPLEFVELLNKADRTASPPTFSPDGLYFMGPAYEAHWQLPGLTPETLALPDLLLSV